MKMDSAPKKEDKPQLNLATIKNNVFLGLEGVSFIKNNDLEKDFTDSFNEYSSYNLTEQEMTLCISASLISKKSQSDELKELIATSENLKTLNTDIVKIEENGSIENTLRIEAFNNMDNYTKETLCSVGEILGKAKYPWGITGSVALKLEADTDKHPDDIDLQFCDIDFPIIYKEFLEKQKNGKVKDLKLVQQIDFNGDFNGCTKIYAKLLVQKKWIEIEAFAQNIDHKLPKNGIANVGLEQIQINQYKENGIDINLIGREEIIRYYKYLSKTEVLLYSETAHRATEGLTFLKNKFPQRVSNLLSIIKRIEHENTGENKIDEITDQNIINLEKMLLVEQKDYDIELKLDYEKHDQLSPIEIIKNAFELFKKGKEKTTGVGFTNNVIKYNLDESIRNDMVDMFLDKSQIRQRGDEYFNTHKEDAKKIIVNFFEKIKGHTREEIVDSLSVISLEDMQQITNSHIQIVKIESEIQQILENYENDKDATENKDVLAIIEEKCYAMSKYTEDLLQNIINKYKEYSLSLEYINSNDNKDLLSFITLKQTLDGHIMPALDLVSDIENRIKKYKETI